jgi:hypothetical protein
MGHELPRPNGNQLDAIGSAVGVDVDADLILRLEALMASA